MSNIYTRFQVFGRCGVAQCVRSNLIAGITTQATSFQLMENIISHLHGNQTP